MVDDAKRLGYGGSAELDGIQVLMTTGGFDTTKSISYLEPLSVVPTALLSRSRVKHADGTEAYTANLSFDVTTNFLAALTTTRLFARGYKFDIGIDDGEDAQEMTDCLVQSLTLSGAAGGIITASLTAIGATAPAASLTVKNDYIRESRSALPSNDVPLGYWYSGATDVRDWTLTMTQNVSPVYANENVITPRYIKFGLIDFSLSVTTYEAVQPHATISIATSSFTLTGNTASEGFSFAGLTDLGNYAHLFETSAAIAFGSGGSDGIIIV
jgi:hypothetical protein